MNAKQNKTEQTLLPNLIGNYWSQSRQPLVSLIFVAPLLIIYEFGVLLLPDATIRNGADVWLRQFLQWLGLGQYFLLPILTVVVLLSWHHLTTQSWKVQGKTFLLMVVECTLFAGILILIAQIHGRVFQFIDAQPVCSTGTICSTGLVCSTGTGDSYSTLARIVSFMGAGIYEEFLFRLLLLPVVAALLKLTGIRWQQSMLIAAVITSLIFSAAHHIGPQGDDFQLFIFVFRFSAGLFFSLLFVYRGYGIATGTHALYDVWVDLL